MRVSAQVKVEMNTKKVMKSIDQTAAQRVIEASNEVRNTMLNTLSGNRTGRTYRVPGTKRTYTASSPGQAPAQATSGLRQSIKASLEVIGRKVIGVIGTDLPYGIMLEKGTKKMAARPWLLVSLMKTMPKIKEILSRKWL